MEQYRSDFAGYNIEFKLTDGAIAKIAEKAAEEKTGARGLVTVWKELSEILNLNFPQRAFVPLKWMRKLLIIPWVLCLS